LSKYPITEVVVLAATTATVCYWNAWLRIDMTEEMERLFKQCEGVEDYNGICQYLPIFPIQCRFLPQKFFPVL